MGVDSCTCLKDIGYMGGEGIVENLNKNAEGTLERFGNSAKLKSGESRDRSFPSFSYLTNTKHPIYTSWFNSPTLPNPLR